MMKEGEQSMYEHGHIGQLKVEVDESLDDFQDEQHLSLNHQPLHLNQLSNNTRQDSEVSHRDPNNEMVTKGKKRRN